MGRTLTWGIIGAGIIAEQFQAAVKQVDGCRLQAVASKDPGRAAAFVDRNDIPNSCTYDEIVTDPDIDIIYVATTHNFHRDNVKLGEFQNPITLFWNLSSSQIDNNNNSEHTRWHLGVK